MSLRQLLPTGKISEETLRDLSPVFEGERLRQEGRYAEAEERYKDGLAIFPKCSGGRFLIYSKLGVLYESMKEPARAEEVYALAVDEGSVAPFPYLRLAHLTLGAGRCREALDYCNKGLASLKLARTNFFEEIYFWAALRKARRRARRDLGCTPS